MSLTTSPRLRELVGLAREITSTTVARNVEREDAEGLWPEPAMRELADSGLTGLHVPAELGGAGEGFSGLVAISEVLAQESPSTALCFAMHCVGTAVIAAKATDHQKQAYLEPIAQGRHLTTLALSEPGTGSYFWLPQTRLAEREDEYVVSGVKSFITNGGHADSYVVSTAASAPADDQGVFSCVVIEADRPGLLWGGPWVGLGMRSNSSRTLELAGVPVPRSNLLGTPGDQIWYVFEVVAPFFLMAMAGTYLGVAAAALQVAREHLSTRRHLHSGELLGASGVLAHRLGEMWTEVERTRQLVYSAAARSDAGENALLSVLACKAAAGDTAVSVTNEAMTLVGGIGYRENGKLSRMLRDARASHVMAPTTDILKTWVGRALVGLPLL
jgi:isovaleryl-CoA dehydrogenase